MTARSRPSRARCRWVAGLTVVVVAIVATACGTSDAAEPEWVQEISGEGTGSPVSIEPSRGTTLPPTTDDAPEIDTTGEDFDRVWRQIESFETWLLTNPGAGDRLPEIYVPGTEIHGQTSALLADLAARDAVMVVGDYDVLDVELVDRPDADSAVVRYTDTRSFREFVDVNTGEVLEREDFEDQPWTWELVLERSGEGNWRIAAIEFVESS